MAGQGALSRRGCAELVRACCVPPGRCAARACPPRATGPPCAPCALLPPLQAVILTFIARMLPNSTLWLRIWAVLYVAAHAAAMLLARACSRAGPAAAAAGSTLRWRVLQLLTLLNRTCGLGVGGLCAAMHATVVQRQHAPAASIPDGPWALAFSAAHILYASGVCHLVLLAVVWRLSPRQAGARPGGAGCRVHG